MPTQETELNLKVKKTSEKISENIHIVCNDPSLAFFRIQEHVRKVLPPIAEKRCEVIQLQTNLQGHCYDMEYAVSAVKGIEHSGNVFKNIQEMIKTSIFLKQQLKFVEVQNKSKREAPRNSVYKRFSAHLTLDLPELPDFSGVVRETSHRMENMMTSANRSDNLTTQGNVGELQSAVKGIEHSGNVFKNIQEMIKTSIFLKQQLKFVEVQNKSKREAPRNSVYKRFSAHLTLDLPELPDFSGVVRETSHRMENMMTSANRSDNLTTQGNVGELQRSHTTLH